MLRFSRIVFGDHLGADVSNQRSNRSAIVPARTRAKLACSTNSANRAVAYRLVPWTVVVAHRCRPVTASTPK